MTHRAEPQRQLRTVLFTDIVSSTDMAAQLGDRRWRALVARHHDVIRRELKRHRGREMDTAGDGFFATFESPTDGVRCAATVVAAVHGLGLRVRAGLHTGEVETGDGKASGIAVHIAARLLALAGPEEVLVSGTLHDLVAGSGQAFSDRGDQELKGVPGAWHVWALDLPPLDPGVAVAADEDARAAVASRRRERAILGAVVGVLVLVLIGIGAVWLMPAPPETVTGGPDTLMTFSASDGRALDAVGTGRGPSAIETLADAIWVSNLDSGTLTRIDRASGETETAGQVSDRPTGLAASGDRLFVADRYTDEVAVLAASDGELNERLEVHASAIDAGPGAVWTTDDLFDVVRRLDPRTGAELASVQLPTGSGPTDVDAGGTLVWVAALAGDSLLALDPRSLEVVQSIDVPAAERLSVSGDSLWAVSPSLDTATRVDIQASRVALRVEVCDTPVAVAATPGDGGAWVACSSERALWHIDQAGEADRTVSLEAVPTDVAIDGDRVLVTLRED